jgi:hypothetical protein
MLAIWRRCRGFFPDSKAPIVRNGAEVRELATARWGMPSSQHGLMEATKKRAAKLEANGKPVDFKELLRMEPDGGTTNIRTSAIALRGVPLGREIDDLDLFVSDAAFDKIALRFPPQEKDGRDGEKVPFLALGENIEILKSFPGVSFADVLARASKTTSSEDFLVGSLGDIKIWKRAQGRSKDFRDIEAIDTYLTAQKPERNE